MKRLGMNGQGVALGSIILQQCLQIVKLDGGRRQRYVLYGGSIDLRGGTKLSQPPSSVSPGRVRLGWDWTLHKKRWSFVLPFYQSSSYDLSDCGQEIAYQLLSAPSR